MHLGLQTSVWGWSGGRSAVVVKMEVDERVYEELDERKEEEEEEEEEEMHELGLPRSADQPV